MLRLYEFPLPNGPERELLTPAQLLGNAEEKLTAEEKARRQVATEKERLERELAAAKQQGEAGRTTGTTTRTYWPAIGGNMAPGFTNTSWQTPSWRSAKPPSQYARYQSQARSRAAR